MPSELLVRGSAAVQRLNMRIGNLGALVALVAAKDPTASVQSCAINASVIGDAVSGGAMSVINGFGLSNDQKITRITALLKTPQLVYVNVVPDHHFVFFSVDVDKVVILQAFQGSYNYVEWYENRGGGIIKTSEFLQAMTDLISNHEVRKLAAAVKLFSYSLGGRPNAHSAQIERDVREYYRNKTVNIAIIGHKAL